MVMENIGRNGWVAAAVMALGIAGAGCGDDQAAAPGVDTRTTAATQATGTAADPAASARNTLRPLAPLSGSLSGSRQPTFH